ncbi:MAG: gliding motility-associated C-terminal domain-containing protein [Saprospiraceae bacterium]|nr:gliding motility-associated C-terminal domain-containing protein [Saprospiraceae bacterium]
MPAIPPRLYLHKNNRSSNAPLHPIYCYKLNYTKLLYSAIFLFFTISAFATHNRAGEIIFKQIGDLRIRATIVTYTKASSIDADRDTLILYWGDGTFDKIGRNNGGGKGVIIGPDIKYNIYTFEHTYPSRGTYTMSMTDPNRDAGILNVNPPNSENIPFYIETTFTFLNSTFQGYNNAPTLLQPPIDIGCIGQVFVHNPNAFDIDGDSLVYEKIVPMMSVGTPVPNYVYPDQIVAGTNNILTLNSQSGDMIWNAPRKAGEYNIAIRIKEYRQGILISSTVRDMQIIIENCNNRPPNIETIDDVCVVVGQTLQFDVKADDPDGASQQLKLSALGGPFSIEGNKAVFNAPDNYVTPPVSATFTWAPDCNAISNSSYSVIFKAQDNQMDSIGLADLKTVRIKVIGPGPENLTGESSLNSIILKWDQPYLCEVTRNNYFKGFNIWRRVSSNSFQPDTCNPSLEGKGYTKIAFNQKSFDGEKFTYTDTLVERGKAYCYRVEAEFALTSPGGFPYNKVQSLPSNEICVLLNLDVPLITKASILSTGTNDSVLIHWIKPRISDFDTLMHPGPYKYILKWNEGLQPNNFIEIPEAQFTTQHFLDPVDTSFIHTNLNTRDTIFTYQVDFYAGNTTVPYGSSTPASTVYLHVAGSDKKTILTWSESVPWSNNSFTIYRKNAQGIFDSITTTHARKYEDTGLENGKEYCYKIKTSGSYGISGLPNPITNFSQEACAVPIDTVPPCAPILTINNDCNNAASNTSIINKLSWNNPDENCGTPGDTKGYRVYVIFKTGIDPLLIYETDNPDNLTFEYANEEFGLAGCYYVVAIDSVFNESPKSNVVCMENCPDYRLPSAFSPNNDGHNDVFTPYPYRFVTRVDFKVFNRWGNIIFETSDPDLNWKGVNKSGNNVPDGTYFYSCEVYEAIYIDQGITKPRRLTGYIELIR